jgi:hypothetical protein
MKSLNTLTYGQIIHYLPKWSKVTSNFNKTSLEVSTRYQITRTCSIYTLALATTSTYSSVVGPPRPFYSWHGQPRRTWEVWEWRKTLLEAVRLSAAAKTTMIRRAEDVRAYGLSHALVLYRHTVCVQNLAELARGIRNINVHAVKYIKETKYSKMATISLFRSIVILIFYVQNLKLSWKFTLWENFGSFYCMSIYTRITILIINRRSQH